MTPLKQGTDIAHYLIDLYILLPSTSNDQMPFSPSPTSPREDPLAAPSRQPGQPIGNTALKLPPFWTASTLTELKIALRNRRPRAVTGWIGEDDLSVEDETSEIDGMGQNDGTIRFLWDTE